MQFMKNGIKTGNLVYIILLVNLKLTGIQTMIRLEIHMILIGLFLSTVLPPTE